MPSLHVLNRPRGFVVSAPEIRPPHECDFLLAKKSESLFVPGVADRFFHQNDHPHAGTDAQRDTDRNLNASEDHWGQREIAFLFFSDTFAFLLCVLGSVLRRASGLSWLLNKTRSWHAAGVVCLACRAFLPRSPSTRPHFSHLTLPHFWPISGNHIPAEGASTKKCRRNPPQ